MCAALGQATTFGPASPGALSRLNSLCIFGTGGFARETLCYWLDAEAAAGRPIGTPRELARRVCFMVSDDHYSPAEVMGVPVRRESEIDPGAYEMLVAVAEPAVRRRIVARLPAATRYATLVHPSAVVSAWVRLGEGSIVAPGCVLTCNIEVGRHAQLNLHTTIGHDCRIGDFFTAAPGARISGACRIGAGVYVGTNAALRQQLSIADDVTVGMSAVVVQHLTAPGTYVGNPARRLRGDPGS